MSFIYCLTCTFVLESVHFPIILYFNALRSLEIVNITVIHIAFQVHESAWDNPVVVSRRMSAAVNSQDDKGILSGRWDGNYHPYSKPTKWTGSQRILEVKKKKRKTML